MSQPTPAEPQAPQAPQFTIAQFKAAAAEAIFTLTETGRVSRDRVVTTLSNVGISPYNADGNVRVSTNAGEHMSITLTDADAHAELPNGVEPGDLNADAIARLDEKYLAQLRRAFWTEVQRRTDRGEFQRDEAIAALRDLGYSEENLPNRITTVTATVLMPGMFTSYGDPIRRSVSGELRGDYTTAEATAALQEQATDLPETALFKAAFPGQDIKGLPQAVEDVGAYARSVWPRYTP